MSTTAAPTKPPMPAPSLSGSSSNRQPPSSDVQYTQQSPVGHAASTASEVIKGRREEHAGHKAGDRAAEEAGRKKREGAGKRIDETAL